MSKQIVELLVGPVASGKSTYSRKRAKEGFIIINDDAIVNALHCNFYNLYNKELKPLYKIVENTILQTSLSMGKSVVIDRPNYSVEMRRRYIAISNSLDIPVIGVKFKDEGAKEHASRRVKSDSRGVTLEYWIDVYNNHKKLYKEPDLSEGFTDIIDANIEDIL